ncbi:hypothetical protein HDV03_002089 [Kappamyces sp. JEL0829]|nr:hypothetical protein HDV03_002089 [Kappamyces sp. JEL0829]
MWTWELPLEPRFWIALGLCLAISLLAFFSSTTSGNYSFVDREWSISPIAYAWILSSGSNSRSIAMAVFITCWGCRLTFNFWRRGGYHKGEQDYRWPILYKIFQDYPPIAWHMFNFWFISLYQNLLLFLITLPVYVASLDGSAWAGQDTVLLVACFVLLLGEWAADQQQWTYQTKKYALIKEHGDIAKIPIPYRYGFRTTGLFRFSRHPNFFCEFTTWFVLSLFTISFNLQAGLWFYSFLGTLLLTTLFLGSTKFTEDITASKYPLYREYQKCTSALIPLPAKPFAPTLQLVEETNYRMAIDRKVDVDEIIGDEDAFEEEVAVAPDVLENVARQRMESAKQALSRGDIGLSIKTLCQNDPLVASPDPGLEAIKTAFLGVLFACLSQAKSNDIPAVVGALSVPEMDVLMRYLYKAMASPASYTPSVLLAWHEKVVEAAGVGCIARSLTARSRI